MELHFSVKKHCELSAEVAKFAEEAETKLFKFKQEKEQLKGAKWNRTVAKSLN